MERMAPTDERAQDDRAGRPSIDRTYDQATMFGNRLLKNRSKLSVWARRHRVDCFRLYDRDIPELPFVVDWYDGRLHAAEYERPHTRTPIMHAAWLSEIMAGAAEALEVPEELVWLKRRERQRGVKQYERFGGEGAWFNVPEQGLHFRVNLSDYLDTGLFLDHRITRSMVRDMASGRRMLNLFAYTGAFSVYAAAGGAQSTTTVDLSNTYLDWARENFSLNQLYGTGEEFVRADTWRFLSDARARREQWDLIVVDPPTFSNSRKMDDVFDVQRDHVELLRRVLDVTAAGGIIIFSTNFRKFNFAASDLPVTSIQEISDKTMPPDFRNTRIHRAWKIIR